MTQKRSHIKKKVVIAVVTARLVFSPEMALAYKEPRVSKVEVIQVDSSHFAKQFLSNDSIRESIIREQTLSAAPYGKVFFFG